ARSLPNSARVTTSETPLATTSGLRRSGSAPWGMSPSYLPIPSSASETMRVGLDTTEGVWDPNFRVGSNGGERAFKVNGKALRIRDTLVLESPTGEELY